MTVHRTITRKKASPKKANRAHTKTRYPKKVVSLNPPFPPDYQFAPSTWKLTHGYIQLTDELDPNHGAIMHFLYNPQTLTYTSAVMQSLLQPQYRLPADTGVAIFPGTTTLSFDLLFDRSYEMYTDPVNAVSGTLRDMAALNKITNYANGYLLQNRVMVTIGGKHAPTFDGMIASCTVTHQRFNSNMVPMTTTVSLGFTQLTGAGDPANAAPGLNSTDVATLQGLGISSADPYANPQNLPPVGDDHGAHRGLGLTGHNG